MLSARIVRVTQPRCAGCVTPHRGSVTPLAGQRSGIIETRYSGEPYSANSPPRGREVVCAHGLRPEGGSRRTWQHGAVQLSAPPALLQSGLPSMGARTNPCLLARVLTRTVLTPTRAYSHDPSLPPSWDLSFLWYFLRRRPHIAAGTQPSLAQPSWSCLPTACAMGFCPRKCTSQHHLSTGGSSKARLTPRAQLSGCV